jgi:hypothetical protein
MFIKGFMMSFFIIAVLLGVGVLGYQLTVHYWNAPEEDAVVAFQEDTKTGSIVEASVDDISKNLIYCYNKKTKEIKKIVLEVFNCESNTLTYVTIPVRTKFTMSDSLYKKMILVNPEIPQVMKLSTMMQYLDMDTVFDYGVLIIEDLLGIDVSYYTAIPEKSYEKIFTEEYPNTGEGEDTVTKDQSADRILPVETFSDDYQELLRTLDSEDKISSYIEDTYASMKSNLTLQDKRKYLDSYLEIKQSDISFELIAGNNQNSAFIIDNALTAEQLNRLITAE